MANKPLQPNIRTIAQGDLRFRWCSIPSAEPRTIWAEVEEPALILHVKLAGSARTESDNYTCTMRAGEHSLFYMENFSGAHHFTPGKDQQAAFFEAHISPDWFERTWGDDPTAWGPIFREAVGKRRNAWAGVMRPLSAEMHVILRSMEQCRYQGHMQKRYLEAKLIEFLLLQADGWGQRTDVLPSRDVERIHAAKAYIDQHYDEPCSITDLARRVGVNQQKLKMGFRELWDVTVFGYLSDKRMQEAWRLLREEKMCVGEVADRVGYKYPHHFTAAFKRRFGVLPKDLKA